MARKWVYIVQYRQSGDWSKSEYFGDPAIALARFTILMNHPDTTATSMSAEIDPDNISWPDEAVFESSHFS